MTMTPTKGNKLIAEFMGGKLHDTGNVMHVNIRYWLFPDGGRCNEYELKYHTSWDWLMPVVEKIGSLSYNDSNNKFQPSVERFLENDIESIWRQIVIFITWYNQQNP